MVKEIILSQGKVTLVDDEDFEYLNQWNWAAQPRPNTFYACRNMKLNDGKYRFLQMHRVILNPKQEVFIDHIDGNGLNNQKSNLRLCTSRQNTQNKSNINKTSKYPGVHKRKN